MKPLRAIGWAALAALLALLGAAALVWRGSEALLRPGPGSGGAPVDPKSAAGLDFEEVRFRTAGGSELAGWFVPVEYGLPFGVALVHPEGSDRRALLDHLPFLHEAGYSLLLFDHRGHGASEGATRGSGLGYRELHDVSAAVRYLKRERGMRRAAAFGISLGADAVLFAAAGDPEIDLALAESPFASPGDLARAVAPGTPEPLRNAAVELALLRAGALGEPWPIDLVARIAPTPLVLVGGAEDRVVSSASLEALFAAAAEPKEIWIAPRGDHAALLAAQPQEYRERILTYLRRWLGPSVRPAAAVAAPPVEGAAPAP